MDIQDLGLSVWQNRWKTGFVFLLIMSATTAITFSIPKTYRSDGELLARLGRENVMLEPTAMIGHEAAVIIPQSRENEINSIAEILKSRLLIEKVVDAVTPALLLDLPDGQPATTEQGPLAVGSPRQRAIRLVSQQLRTDPVKRSDVISVSYEGQSPEVAQTVVARALDIFVEEYLKLNRAPHAQEFLDEQTRQLHGNLQSRENDLRKMKDATGLSDPEGQRKVLTEQIGHLEDDLAATKAAKEAAAAQLAALHGSLAQLPLSQVAAEMSGIGNEGTDLMRQQFYGLQVKEKEAKSIYSPEHPKMQQITEELAEAKAVLDRQEPTRNHVTTSPNKAYEETHLALMRQEELLAGLAAKAASIATELADRRGRLKSVNENELGIARLRREIAIEETNYRKYRETVEQARIDKALSDERLSNIRTLQPATYDPKPVAPNKLRCLLLGALLAGGSSIGVALVAQRRDRGRKDPQIIEKTFGAAGLAAQPHLVRRRSASESLEVNGGAALDLGGKEP